MRCLNVYAGSILIGQLLESDNLWRFSYHDEWMKSAEGFDLAPAISRQVQHHTDGATHRPVQWFFDNLLPEELLRQSVAKEAGISGDDAFSLLQYLGAESAGALTLLPIDQSITSIRSVRGLSFAQLNSRIAKLPHITLTAEAPKRMSLAGAQHKLLVVYHDGQLYEPVGATPSTHILKPNHPDADNYPASVVNEYLTMRLAAAVGLSTPKVYMHYLPEPVYIIERFDRVQPVPEHTYPHPNTAVERRHAIDACQLLNKSRIFKHTGATIDALQNIIEATTNKAYTRLTLFRWLVFNIAVANDDCHLKNLSFFVSPEGIQLAPHYDLLATGAYYTRAFANEKATWPHVRMAYPLGDVHYLSDITAPLLLHAGAQLGIPKSTARRILHEVTTRLRAALGTEHNAIRQRHRQAPESAKVFLAGEERLLRVLENIVIKEMLEKIGF